MKLILDAQLASLIQQNQLVRGIADKKHIKGCSVDLTIGSIFVPGSENDSLGSVNKPRRELPLAQGQTVVVRTAEKVALGATQAGVAFPASGVSLQGLLMTNPGHIDPGYEGHLHVTVINMAKEAYALKQGGRLLRTLFFELDQPVQHPYQVGASPVDEELLNKLSSDFLSVQSRAEAAASRAVDRAEFRGRLLQVLLPVLTGIIGIVAAWFATSQKLDERITQLDARVPAGVETRLAKVEALVPVVTRLDGLELRTLRNLDERIGKLEATQRAK